MTDTRRSPRGGNSSAAAARRHQAKLKAEGPPKGTPTGCASTSRSRGAKVSLRPLPGGARVNLRRPVRVGAWNVRTLRRTGSDVQLAGELARLRVSVAALSEVRWPGTGRLKFTLAPPH